MTIVGRTIKYRLYPTPAQETILRETLSLCREVYNSCLNWRKHDYERFGTSPSRFDQVKALPGWKQSHPELTEVYSDVLQEVCKRVDLAFQAFFRRLKNGEKPGYPRFKGEGNYDSFTYPNLRYGNIRLEAGAVLLPKIGLVKAILHRELPGIPKTCTVCIQSGKWFACFFCEVEAEALPASEEKVGIDVGLNHFAVTSDGEYIENPRFFRKEEKALAKAQRKLARQKRGSKARRKAKKVVCRIHERTRNRRHNFVHQLSRRLVNRFGFIAIEDLNVENMSARPKPKQDEETGEYLKNGARAKSGLNKSIADAAWSMFRSVLTYKAANAGRVLIAVPPAYTTQDCSECGNRAEKTLSERIHVCLVCGLVLCRDVNAAKNILKIAIGLYSLVAQAA